MEERGRWGRGGGGEEREAVIGRYCMREHKRETPPLRSLIVIPL